MLRNYPGEAPAPLVPGQDHGQGRDQGLDQVRVRVRIRVTTISREKVFTLVADFVVHRAVHMDKVRSVQQRAVDHVTRGSCGRSRWAIDGKKVFANGRSAASRTTSPDVTHDASDMLAV